MSPSEATATGNIQSIRSSCDRCRFHKLKCNVPGDSGGSVPCERCTRAKAPCVFGRRRRANRSSDDKKAAAQAAQAAQTSRPTTAPVAIPSPASTASTPALGSDPSTGPGSDRPSTGSGESKAEEAASASTTTFDARPWESLMAGLVDGSSDSVHGQASSENSWDSLQQSLQLDDAYMFDADSLDPTTWSPPASLLPTLTLATEYLVRPGELHMASSWGSVQRLLSLIADIKQRLKILEQGPWQAECHQNLDDYPVGTILHLSQEFVAIAGPFLSRASAPGAMRTSMASRNQVAEPGTRADQRSDRHTDFETTASEVDTATALLVLVGYTWLVRIYGVVLSHFQVHLTSLSWTVDPTDGTGVVMVPNSSPTLQLGELPSASAAPELGRIHTALGMLLGALHEVEEQLGRGGAVARNLVVALLTQEAILRAGEVHDDCGGLGSKVQAVKELLREKMGF